MGAAHGLVAPTLLSWRPGAAAAASALGRHDLAAVEVEAVRRIGARRPLGVALRTAGVVQGGEAGLALLEEAVAVLQRSPAALEHARALVELGSALRAAGRAVPAREPLRSGLEAATTLGAGPLAARARRELHAAGGRHRPREAEGVAGLTPTERRVAGLAAGGAGTAEIARSLFLSPKTVEWHLSNTYRKLGVRGRQQIAQLLT